MLAKLNQHEQRQIALATLYTLSANPKKSQDAALAYALNYERAEVLEAADFELLMELVDGVSKNKAALDEKLRTFLTKEWNFSRLTRIEKTILRLGAYEMTQTKTPGIVALDEAINLTKEFSDEAAVKLVNGILSNLTAGATKS